MKNFTNPPSRPVRSSAPVRRAGRFVLFLIAGLTSLAFAQAPVAPPFFENFDAEANCTASTTTACPLLGQFQQDQTDGGDWVVDNGGTGSINTGPSVDHTTGTGTGKYLYTETSGAIVGSERILLSPPLDIGLAVNPLVTYWYHMFGGQMGTLHTDLVQTLNAGNDAQSIPGTGTGTLTSATSLFTAGLPGDTITVTGSTSNDGIYTIVSVIDDFTVTVTPDFTTNETSLTYRHDRVVLDIVPSVTDNLDQWQRLAIPILPALQPPGNALNVRVRIRGVAGSGLESDMAIDDFSFIDGVGDDIGVASIDTPGSSSVCAGSYLVTATIENFGTNSQTNIAATLTLDGTTLVTDTIPGPINGGATIAHTFSVPAVLVPGTSIIDVITTLAGDTNAGNDLLSQAYGVTASVTSFPYLEDFEGGTGGWSVSGTTTSWNFGFPITPLMGGAASGLFCFVTNQTGNYQNNESGFVRSPCFDLSGLANPYLSVSLFWECDFSNDGMSLEYSTDGGTNWFTLGAVGDELNWFNDNTVPGLPGTTQLAWTGRVGDGNGSGGWMTASHDLAIIAGSNSVEFRVSFASNASVTAEGVGFDDFRIFDAVSPFPGSGEDIRLETGVAGDTISAFPGLEIKTAMLGDQVSIRTVSPGGTYVGAPYALVADPYPTGGPPPVPLSPMFPEAHIGLTAVVVADGNAPAQSGGLPFVIANGGSTLDFFALDPVLIGNSVLLQSLVLDSAAANGFFAISDGLVVEVQ